MIGILKNSHCSYGNAAIKKTNTKFWISSQSQFPDLILVFYCGATLSKGVVDVFGTAMDSLTASHRTPGGVLETDLFF